VIVILLTLSKITCLFKDIRISIKLFESIIPYGIIEYLGRVEPTIMLFYHSKNAKTQYFELQIKKIIKFDSTEQDY